MRAKIWVRRIFHRFQNPDQRFSLLLKHYSRTLRTGFELFWEQWLQQELRASNGQECLGKFDGVVSSRRHMLGSFDLSKGLYLF